MSNAAPISFEYEQARSRLGFGLPARMTVLPLARGRVALVSPIPIDDALAARIATLGKVAYLIAPNLLHHLYLGAASARYPQARVLAPAGLRTKRPDLRIDGELGCAPPEELASAVELVPIEGAPSLGEVVLFHRTSRTLVVTDLVFNVLRPRGLLTHLVLLLVGCHGRFAQSRAFRALVKDRAATARSVAQLLALPFETLIVAHGDPVRDGARSKLAAALRWLLPKSGVSLPARS